MIPSAKSVALAGSASPTATSSNLRVPPAKMLKLNNEVTRKVSKLILNIFILPPKYFCMVTLP